ncbi:MAG: CoB--CoM heterodisulfide reductase iron-sulfur subunit B family protein [Spirochaetaceae bacterium]|nr:MAG: CoB--CoM heterodisulfide reductase iron-sulfur subunit B family protein [Spirochaetaceae bacterium]
MTRVTYYPGCSLESTAREYQQSLLETFRLLDVELVELEDWNCCGATSAHSLDDGLARGLPARNLALASATTDLMVVPCAACYSRQKTAEVLLSENPALKTELEGTLRRSFERPVSVKNILDYFLDHMELIRSRVQRPLSELRVVCYYGCLLTRPPKITGEKSYEDPQGMDEIVRALGATALPWSYKTECCGGSHSIARADLVYVLVSKIFAMAREAEAQAIITACPLCQMNLDTRQRGAQRLSGEKYDIPSIYITELMSMAFGSAKTGAFFKKHFISPAKILDRSAAV